VNYSDGRNLEIAADRLERLANEFRDLVYKTTHSPFVTSLDGAYIAAKDLQTMSKLAQEWLLDKLGEKED
jgi:hypothetical protein